MADQGTSGDLQDGFVFRGEALALDFVNTLIVERGRQLDLLALPADLDRWWTIARERYALGAAAPGAASAELLAHAHALRTALHRICTAAIRAEPSDATDHTTVNAALALAHATLTQDALGTYQQLDTVLPPTHAVRYQIARAALTLLTTGDLRRLHQCRNARCVLLFYDTTKSGTRQWCSLTCFNRTRSTERYRQQQAAKAAVRAADAPQRR